ncbi:hypothetical protein [Paenibacillus silviterrae]|uniref:hypothetical protein n=1 Tax=Paenibacillus silviterrae TaxID=3242194 RepID=UPI002543B17E|nr:hypothetical protein [Paenibacillus chinjuensis]
MRSELAELKSSFKFLIQNLITRIDEICNDLESDDVDRLIFWIEDLSVLTESMVILSQNKEVEIDVALFNEKVEMLLNKFEDQDYIYVADILKFEIKPLLTYWDGCIIHD